MAYPTLAQVKDQLSISGSDQDMAVQSALDAAIGGVESYCGYEWEKPDSMARVFHRQFYSHGKTAFNVSDPGLLSWTAATGYRDNREATIREDDVYLLRWSGKGAGAWDVFRVKGNYDRVSITGVWGQASDAPPEVSQVVLILAIRLYQMALGGGYVEDVMDFAQWKGSEIAFLLAGHKRAR